MDMISRLRELTTAGTTFCLATVVDSPDPATPPGCKMIVFPNGTTEGSTGSAGQDTALIALALESLKEKKKRTALIGESLQVFFDIFSEDVHLLVCGAGHIALPLARFAREVGFRVTVLDDRSDFAYSSRFPGCEVMVGDFAPTLHELPLGPSTFTVIITRGHEHDVECLKEILQKETAYVGLIGSRRRVHFVLEILGKQGIAGERLTEVFTPIGLPIGSESPEEIALAIVAELVCVRRKGAGPAQTLRAAAGEAK